MTREEMVAKIRPLQLGSQYFDNDDHSGVIFDRGTYFISFKDSKLFNFKFGLHQWTYQKRRWRDRGWKLITDDPDEIMQWVVKREICR